MCSIFNILAVKDTQGNLFSFCISDNIIKYLHGGVGRALDWGSRGCWLEPSSWLSHCVVSLSQSLYPLLSTD